MSMEKNVPVIRFHDFDRKWREVVLDGACSNFRSGKFIKAEDIKEDGAFPVYGGNGLRGFSSEYNHDGLYALIGRQGALCGNMNLSDGKAFFTEHAIAVQANTENDTLFLYYKLGLMNLGQYSGQSAQPGLSVNNLIMLCTSVPEYIEQTQIGNTFQKLDSLINQHQQKHEKLSNIKKAMLEKMFPKVGETAPEIRFKGFSGDWDEKELHEIANYRNGKAHEQVIDPNGKFIVVNSKFVSTNGMVKKHSIQQISPMSENEIAFVLSDVPNGKALARTFLINSDYLYTLNQRIAGITPDEFTHYYFLHILLNRNSYFLKFDDGVKQTNLSVSDVEQFKSFYPTHDEQTKIGNYFQKLDVLINQHQQQITKLNNIKQACLTKMFV